jgi:hypothetical protein
MPNSWLFCLSSHKLPHPQEDHGTIRIKFHKKSVRFFSSEMCSGPDWFRCELMQKWKSLWEQRLFLCERERKSSGRMSSHEECRWPVAVYAVCAWDPHRRRWMATERARENPFGPRYALRYYSVKILFTLRLACMRVLWIYARRGRVWYASGEMHLGMCPRIPADCEFGRHRIRSNFGSFLAEIGNEMKI